MRTPVTILSAGAGISLLLSIITGLMAANATNAASAASSSAASNIWLTLTGVAVIGLLVIWAVFKMLEQPQESKAAPGTVWSDN